MDKIKFADRLTDLRKAQHMTQADLAKKLNISPQAVSKWETGESIPDIEMLELLADLYGLTLDELIRGETSTNINNDKVIEEQVTPDAVKHKRNISLLNIILSSFMLLAFLIFGFSEFYEVSNLGYFSLYDILFALGSYKVSNFILLLLTLSFIASCVLSIIYGANYKRNSILAHLRNIFAAFSLGGFVGYIIKMLSYGMYEIERVGIGAYILALIILVYFVLLLVLDENTKNEYKENKLKKLLDLKLLISYAFISLCLMFSVLIESANATFTDSILCFVLITFSLLLLTLYIVVEITRLKNKNIVFILDIIGLSIMCITLLIYSFSVKIVTGLALFALNGGLIVYIVINYIKICKLLKNSNK